MCGYEQDILKHHETPMKASASVPGKVEKLICGVCGNEAPIPIHCRAPMKIVD